MSLWFLQFRALLRKNYLLKRRKLWSTLFEVLLPFLVMSVIVGIHSAVESEDIPADLRLQDRIEFRLGERISDIQSQLETLDARLAFLPGDSEFLQAFNQVSPIPSQRRRRTRGDCLDLSGGRDGSVWMIFFLSSPMHR